jgi:hypothetical protein
MASETSRFSKLDKDTLVPLGVVLTICGAAFGAHTYLSSQFNSLDRRLERIELKQEASSANQWTVMNMKYWALRLEKSNPTLKIPEVEDE